MFGPLQKTSSAQETLKLERILEGLIHSQGQNHSSKGGKLVRDGMIFQLSQSLTGLKLVSNEAKSSHLDNHEKSDHEYANAQSKGTYRQLSTVHIDLQKDPPI
eukprot:TRINITY_DN105763_c0_g1_i1.p1 TRINITY_DN105763_c0_g1~~TRINITY_DN105763_c0_g1_i1.p1  ORF type:complete len:103 (+),score=16.97 TRINITY_DN105763_c0_g1_i1:209-517(+)